MNSLLALPLISSVRHAIVPRFPAAEENLIRIFRIYMATFSVLDHLFGRFGNFSLDFSGYRLWIALALGAAWAAQLPKTAILARRLGLAVLLAYHLHAVVANFPLSGNHKYLEVFVYLSLLILPFEHAGAVLRYAILTVYFYSGVQKLAHGYHWSGEIHAVEAYALSDGVADVIRDQLRNFGALFSLPIPPMPAAVDPIGATAVQYPHWVASLFQLAGRLVILLEITLPLYVFKPRARHHALGGLLLLGFAISALAGEFEFASTNIACLLLFYPKQAQWTYPLAFVALRIAGGPWVR